MTSTATRLPTLPSTVFSSLCNTSIPTNISHLPIGPQYVAQFGGRPLGTSLGTTVPSYRNTDARSTLNVPSYSQPTVSTTTNTPRSWWGGPSTGASFSPRSKQTWGRLDTVPSLGRASTMQAPGPNTTTGLQTSLASAWGGGSYGRAHKPITGWGVPTRYSARPMSVDRSTNPDSTSRPAGETRATKLPFRRRHSQLAGSTRQVPSSSVHDTEPWQTSRGRVSTWDSKAPGPALSDTKASKDPQADLTPATATSLAYPPPSLTGRAINTTTQGTPLSLATSADEVSSRQPGTNVSSERVPSFETSFRPSTSITSRQSTAVPGKSCLRAPQTFPDSPTFTSLNYPPIAHTETETGKKKKRLLPGAKTYFRRRAGTLTKNGMSSDYTDTRGFRHIISQRDADDVTEGEKTHTVLDQSGRIVQHWDVTSSDGAIVPGSLFTVRAFRGNFLGENLESQLNSAMDECGASTRGASRLTWGRLEEMEYDRDAAPDQLREEASEEGHDDGERSQ